MTRVTISLPGDVAAALERVDEAELVLRRDTGEDRDAVDALLQFGVAHLACHRPFPDQFI